MQWGSVRQWHWISGAITLVGMLLFAITGITLNHAADIPASPQVTTLEVALPDGLLDGWQPQTQQPAQLPDAVRRWLAQQHDLHLQGPLTGEWQDGEFYLALPRPGGDAWLTLAPDTGELFYEHTSRGWISYFNDLHKGRNTSTAWRWLIDIFALACVVFCVSGLLLLVRHASVRMLTWPMVVSGVALPLLVLLLFAHGG